MLKQVTFTVDTSDPLQAQWLVEYLASPDRVRFGRVCLMLGFLAATGQAPTATHPARASGDTEPPMPVPSETSAQPRRGIGKGLFGMD